MTTQKQARAALLKAAYLVYGDDEYRRTIGTLSTFIDEHPDDEPKKPTQFDLLLFLYNNTPYTWAEIGQAFNIRVTVS